MLTFTSGDALESQARTLVCPVAVSKMYETGTFVSQVASGYTSQYWVFRPTPVTIGEALMVPALAHSRAVISRQIIFLPTRRNWWQRIRLADVDLAFAALHQALVENMVFHVAMPAPLDLHDKLKWREVRGLMEMYLEGLTTIVDVYVPGRLMKERR